MADTGGFFIVDRRTFARVCDQGLLAAVAYLVLANGSQRNNRDTDWSVNAITKYAGVGVDRAKQGLKRLVEAHYVTQTKGGTRPHYVLPSWLEIRNSRAADGRSKQSLSTSEKEVFEKVSGGLQPGCQRERKYCESLTQSGWLHKEGELYSADFTAPDPEPAANLIWLPKTLVMGTKSGETSPLTRVRGYQNVALLRLLVNLYHDQNLRDDGGISRDVLYQSFHRAQVGEQSVYRVFAFKRKNTYFKWKGAIECHWTGGAADAAGAVRELLNFLETEGLLTFVPHLCESSDATSEVIHPCGLHWSKTDLNDLENAVGHAANVAGRGMANYPELCEREGEGYSFVAPVFRNYPEAQLVGIARLRYRPRTKRTAEWWGQLLANLPDHIKRYGLLTTEAEKIRNRVAELAVNRAVGA